MKMRKIIMQMPTPPRRQRITLSDVQLKKKMKGHTTGLRNRSMIKTEQTAVHGKKNLDVAMHRECISQGSLGRKLIEGSLY